MYEIQKHEPEVIYIERPVKRRNMVQMAVMVLAVLYWISPVDLIPLIPVDDIVVMIVAYFLSGLGGE